MFFYCFLAFWPLFGSVKETFCLSFPILRSIKLNQQSFPNQSYFPKVNKMPILGILICLYIYIIMFCSTSLVPVEAIITMIRVIKIDHGTNPECSLFGIHIRNMTNDINLGFYICTFCFFQ